MPTPAAATEMCVSLYHVLVLYSSSRPKLCAGDYKTSFHAKAEAIANDLSAGHHDFGFLHVKAIDDTGHDRAAALKVPSPSLSHHFADLKGSFIPVAYVIRASCVLC